MSKYDLSIFIKEEIGNGSKDLVTRPSGEKVRRRIERSIEEEAAGSVVGLDFSKIGVIDYSCADEVVAIRTGVNTIGLLTSRSGSVVPSPESSLQLKLPVLRTMVSQTAAASRPLDFSSAAAPAMCGDAMLVPL